MPKDRPSLLPIFLLSLSLRILNALISRTFFQPDEYWQSLEVAHRLVFGYGYQTWEWRDLAGLGGIRSALYPLLFVPVYWGLEATGLDRTGLLTLAPRLVQAVVAASCDVATYVLARRVLGRRFGNAALFCSLTSFYNAYASTRTFSNSTETALTTVALALWPWSGVEPAGEKDHPLDNERSSLWGALSLAAVATIMRPSNAVIWITLGTSLLYHSPPTKRSSILVAVSTIGSLATISCLALDTLFYGTPSFTPYTFLLTNVVHSISLFYGANASHFYLTQAIPFMSLTMIPFVLRGIFLSKNGRPAQARTVVGWTIAAYSLLGHKEFRFLHPLLPLLHLFAANSLVHPATSSSSSTLPHIGIRRSHALLILLSLMPAIYLTSFHSLAQISVLNVLRHLPLSELRSVAFLMPCHSTPWQSHLHRPDLEPSGEGGRAWFVTCEPPVLGQDSETYRDQSDFFYDDPAAYLRTRFPPIVDPSFPPSPFVDSPSSSAPSSTKDLNDLGWTHAWPSHIVLFDALLSLPSYPSPSLLSITPKDDSTIGDLLREKGYVESVRLWNSHWHEDARRRGDVVLLRWEGGSLGGNR